LPSGISLFVSPAPLSDLWFFCDFFAVLMNIAFDPSLVFSNFANPPILFFFLGMSAVLVRSSLEIPQPLPKFFSLYLLMCIGFKGGTELSYSGLTASIATELFAAMVMASVVPVYSFFILKRKLPLHDAAAIASTYGSISAVTFITAAAFLNRLGIDFGGHLVAAMALMESPAIVIGVGLYKIYSAKIGTDESPETHDFSWRELLRDAFLNGSVFLIVGSLVIGIISGEQGAVALKPFSEDIFKGMLCFFLLDMGLVAAKRIRNLQRAGWFLAGFAVLMPVFNALVGITVAFVLGMSKGDALMFSVLCASASYIAVPAAMRIAIPEANPSLYVPMALAMTFPFNIVIGLPLYLHIITLFWQ
jgi:uncharacterized protein